MFYLIIKVKFIISSIPNGWLFWSVNHTSMSWNSGLNVFKKIWFIRKISNKLPNGYLEQIYTRLSNFVDNHY